jgi:RNA polymerase sigma factor (sigma-70 family)
MAEAKAELIPTRTTLLERIKDWKDDSSWHEFFNIYSRLIRGVAIRSGLTQTEADEVVQETMFAVAKNIPSFKYDRKIGSFKHWLLKMSHWRICDQFRRRGNVASQPPHDLIAETQHRLSLIIDEKSQNFDEFWEIEWQSSVLDAAVKNVRCNLDPEKYQIFDFLINKQWPPARVAKSFGISVNQVYLAKHRITGLIKTEADRLKITHF